MVTARSRWCPAPDAPYIFGGAPTARCGPYPYSVVPLWWRPVFGGAPSVAARIRWCTSSGRVDGTLSLSIGAGLTDGRTRAVDHVRTERSILLQPLLFSFNSHHVLSRAISSKTLIHHKTSLKLRSLNFSHLVFHSIRLHRTYELCTSLARSIQYTGFTNQSSRRRDVLE